MATYKITIGPEIGLIAETSIRITIEKEEITIEVVIETDPDIKVSGTYKDYHTLLTKRLDYLQNMLQNFKLKCLTLLNKDRQYFQYNSEDLAYLMLCMAVLYVYVS